MQSGLLRMKIAIGNGLGQSKGRGIRGDKDFNKAYSQVFSKANVEDGTSEKIKIVRLSELTEDGFEKLLMTQVQTTSTICLAGKSLLKILRSPLLPYG